MNTQPDQPARPECGAPLVDGLSCWEMLGGLIAWEAQDPELLAEHFLTVASYNLQHPAQFTDAAITGLRAIFIEHLDHGLAIVEIRRRMRRTLTGGTRAQARGRAEAGAAAVER